MQYIVLPEHDFKIFIAKSERDITSDGLSDEFWLLGGRAYHSVIPLYIDRGVILCLSNCHDRSNKAIAAIVHECEHVKQFLLEMSDVQSLIEHWDSTHPPIEQGEKEFHAYLLQRIVNLVLDAI